VLPDPAVRLHEPAPAAAAAPGTDRPRTGADAIPPAALLLTLNDVAALVQVSRRQVERWLSAGAIPGVVRLPGRAVRLRRDLVLQWIEGGCPRPAGKRR
jgi:excisionase family DNA binding protein